ncbi:hypothetical protein N5P18_11890 [Janibacter terrae]|uniref:Uncharacterized protein n=1 Tax=Janibacter terrae TaxID=103817 RepID=A0ABZ2FC69_9MICO|nr:hypothetical protein [Janibacter terrae]MBA4086050.1 hypothetical protein [Kytococcus sp.]HBO53955.1 hypothetical protein [Janibacter terrae]HCE60939.1 hypothetical protein [Janibacter terrae]
MRVYLPLLLAELGAVAADARLPERSGYIVSDALRAADTEADEEDLEFEAMCQALDAARGLGPGRRVVAAADIADAPATGRGAGLDRPVVVPLGDVVSFHVEEEAGEVGAGYDDLLWYDVTELSDLT